MLLLSTVTDSPVPARAMFLKLNCEPSSSNCVTLNPPYVGLCPPRGCLGALLPVVVVLHGEVLHTKHSLKRSRTPLIESANVAMSISDVMDIERSQTEMKEPARGWLSVPQLTDSE